MLSDGILKLHLSDYRRRVLERFDVRLTSLRGEVTANPHGTSAHLDDLDTSLDPVGT